MKQLLKAPISAAVLSLGLTFSAQADMQDRLAMIEALEVTQDYDLLNELVANDYGLNEFHRVLSRAAAHHEDIDLITTLLNLPSLDKDSAEFKRAVSGVFSYLGQFEEQNVNILETLLPYFANDQKSLDNSLFFIFEGASGVRNYVMPASDAARLLVREGADLDKVYKYYELTIENEIDRLEEDLEEFEDFRDLLVTPNP